MLSIRFSLLVKAFALAACAWLPQGGAAAAKQDSDALVPGCLLKAADHYKVDYRIMLAIREVEGGRNGLESRNTNGTSDLGYMQVNTLWLKDPNIVKAGITRAQIRDNECMNYWVATWIYRMELDRAKGDVWRAAGNYHSKTPKYHNRYLPKVKRAFSRQEALRKAYHEGKGLSPRPLAAAATQVSREPVRPTASASSSAQPPSMQPRMYAFTSFHGFAGAADAEPLVQQVALKPQQPDVGHSLEPDPVATSVARYQPREQPKTAMPVAKAATAALMPDPIIKPQRAAASLRQVPAPSTRGRAIAGAVIPPAARPQVVAAR